VAWISLDDYECGRVELNCSKKGIISINRGSRVKVWRTTNPN
jgi:hypothetical protein